MKFELVEKGYWYWLKKGNDLNFRAKNALYNNNDSDVFWAIKFCIRKINVLS